MARNVDGVDVSQHQHIAVAAEPRVEVNCMITHDAKDTLMEQVRTMGASQAQGVVMTDILLQFWGHDLASEVLPPTHSSDEEGSKQNKPAPADSFHGISRSEWSDATKVKCHTRISDSANEVLEVHSAGANGRGKGHGMTRALEWWESVGCPSSLDRLLDHIDDRDDDQDSTPSSSESSSPPTDKPSTEETVESVMERAASGETIDLESLSDETCRKIKQSHDSRKSAVFASTLMSDGEDAYDEEQVIEHLTSEYGYGEAGAKNQVEPVFVHAPSMDTVPLDVDSLDEWARETAGQHWDQMGAKKQNISIRTSKEYEQKHGSLDKWLNAPTGEPDWSTVIETQSSNPVEQTERLLSNIQDRIDETGGAERQRAQLLLVRVTSGLWDAEDSTYHDLAAQYEP